MKTLEGFRKVIEDLTDITEEQKKEIIESAEVFYEFRDAMIRKFYIEGEDMDLLMEHLIDNHLSTTLTDPELGLMHMDPNEAVGESLQMFASKHGFEKPIKDAFLIILKYIG